MSTEEQLISFFAYSMFIYPVTSYLVSPKRSYSRWKGAIYAVLFLFMVFVVQIVYENKERGLNHYQLLNVTRFDSVAMIRKAYKRLSLELHPDKNKAETAKVEFQRVKSAYDVLSSAEFRKTYDRLGEAGVKVAAHAVIDVRHVVLQMIIYYGSSAVFAFLMTISEPSGDAMEVSFVGLAAMLLIESLLVLQEFSLPKWFLPQSTSHDVVAFLHRFFPAFMNGSRSILGAFHTDPKVERETSLAEVVEGSKTVTLRVSSLIQSLMASKYVAPDPTEDSSADGLVAEALRIAKRHVDLSPDKREVCASVAATARLVSDPVALRKKDEDKYRHMWVLYLLGYVAARYLIGKTAKKSS